MSKLFFICVLISFFIYLYISYHPFIKRKVSKKPCSIELGFSFYFIYSCRKGHSFKVHQYYSLMDQQSIKAQLIMHYQCLRVINPERYKISLKANYKKRCLYWRLIMFPNYKGKLITIMWMGLGSALLSSIFSAILIAISINTYQKVNKISNR